MCVRERERERESVCVCACIKRMHACRDANFFLDMNESSPTYE